VLASAAVNTDADAVKSAGVDAHELGGALPVAGAISGLAKGTASIEFASGAENTGATKPEALEPRAYGKAGCGQESPPQGEARRDTRGCQKKATGAASEHERARMRKKCERKPNWPL
jgi:hypothetical protein